jgi:hypothetical protein
MNDEQYNRHGLIINLSNRLFKTAPEAVSRRCAAIVNAHPPQADCAFQNAARLG